MHVSKILHLVCFYVQKRKYILYYTILYNVQHLTCGSFKYKKPLLGVMASSARVRTSLRSNLQLRINCPTSHKLLVPPLPLTHPSSAHSHTCDAISNRQKMISAHLKSSWPHTLCNSTYHLCCYRFHSKDNYFKCM
jgi:hypothetical protein